MFWKMVFGALGRQRGKHIGIALTVALGVSLATAMLGVMFDVGDKVNQELKSYGANLNIVPRGGSMAGDKYEFEEGGKEGLANLIPEAELYKIKMIFWAYNIVDFAPYLEVQVMPAGAQGAPAGLPGRPAQGGHAHTADHPMHAGHGDHAGGIPNGEGALEAPAQGRGAPGGITLVGTWFRKELKLPTGEEVETGMIPLKSWWKLNGEPGDDSDANGVLVGRDVADRLKLSPGDVFPVITPKGERLELKVRGVFSSGGEEDSQVFSPMALAQNAAGLPGMVGRVEASALTTPENELSRRAARNPDSLSQLEKDTWYCTAYISSIAYQIEEALPGVRVKPVMRVAESEGPILEKTQLMMVLLTALTLLSSALAISNLVTANIMERSVEIGLMKALGASNFSVALLILCEMLLVGALGGVLGYLAGLGLARLIGLSVFGEAVVVPGEVLPLSALMVLIVVFAGSIPALRSILRLRPTEVLHGR